MWNDYNGKIGLSIIILITLFFINISLEASEKEWKITTEQDFNVGTILNLEIKGTGTNSYLKLSDTDWWNSNWQYRKRLTINNSLSYTLSNFQIFLSTNELGYSSLVSAGKLQTNCEDLRFVTTNFIELSYWLSPNLTNFCGVWVKINKIIASSVTPIYMYYGNPNASSSSSSYDLTMQKITDTESEGCVGLWHFDEGSGTTVNDDSGKGNNGTINSATWVGNDGGLWRDENIIFTNGDSLSFDGAISSVAISDDPSLDGMSACSIELWFKANSLPPSGSQMCLVSKRTSGGPYAYHRIAIDNSTGVLQLAYLEATNKTTSRPSLKVSTNLEIGKWYHICGTFDGTGGEMRIYLNGNLIGSKSVWGQITRTISDLAIGANVDGTEHFDGIIDEVAIYNRALSSNEIISHYERRKYVNPLPSIQTNGETVYTPTSLFTNGIFTSRTYDTKSELGVKISKIKVVGILSNNTFLKLQLASNNDDKNWIFRGKDGTSDSFYTLIGNGRFTNFITNVYIHHTGDRYFKVKVFFKGDGSVTPTLDEIVVYGDNVPTYLSKLVSANEYGLIDIYFATLEILPYAINRDIVYSIEKENNPPVSLLHAPWEVISCYNISAKDSNREEDIKFLDGKIRISLKCKSSDGIYIDGTSIKIEDAPSYLDIAYWTGLNWRILNADVTVDNNVVILSKMISTIGKYGIVNKQGVNEVIDNDEVRIINKVFIPRASDSGINHIEFFIENANNETIELTIYTYEGIPVWKRIITGINLIIWDGRDMNSKIVKPGVYIYKIKKGKEIIKKGTFAVIR